MLINSPNISGSLTVTGNATISGSLNVAGGINATITGSATSASYVEYSNVANKPTLVSGSEQISFNGIVDKPTLVSGSSQIVYSEISSIPAGIVSGSSQVSFNGIVDKPTLVSGSAQVSFNGIVDKPTLVSGSSQITYSGLSGIPTGIVSSSTQIAGYNLFATTGSNQFDGSQAITGSLTVTGQVVAQILNVQQVTSSIVFSSGSNIFGNSLSNTQQFTGSVSVTGSLAVNGTSAVTGTGTTNYLPKFTGASTIGNSQIFDTGSEVRIFTTSTDARNFTLGVYGVTWDNNLFEVANDASVFNKTSADNGDLIQFRTVGNQRGDIRASTTSFTISSRTNLILGSNNTGQMTLNTSGNLGLGVTPSAWSSGKALEISGFGNGFWMPNTLAQWQLNNAIFNSGFKYAYNGVASAYNSESGQHSWYTAPSGTAGNAITFTQAMTLSAAGRLLIGKTNDEGFALDVVGTGRFTPVNTTAYVNTNTLTSGASLHIVNNAVTNNTAATIRLDAVGGDGSLAASTISSVWVGSASSDLTFGTRIGGSSVTERMRITSGGRVGIGVTDPGAALDVNGNIYVSGEVSGRSFPFNTTIGSGADATTTTIRAGSTNGFQSTIFLEGGNVSNTIRFNTASSERMRITSDGGVLIGRTTQAFSPSTQGYMLSVGSSVTQAVIALAASGQTLGSGGVLYGLDSTRSFIVVRQNLPLGFDTNDTERMRITSGGNLEFKGSSSAANGDIRQLGFINTANSANVKAAIVAVNGADSDITSLSFRTSTSSTNISEKLIIAGSGAATFKSSLTVDQGITVSSNAFGNYFGKFGAASTALLELREFTGDQTGTTLILRSSRSNSGNLYAHIQAFSDSTTQVFRVLANGVVDNLTGAYGSLSDIKLKENIVDATPKLEDLLKVKIRNYNLIGDETKQLGVIAQELEEIFPGLVSESEDFEEVEITDEEGNITKEKQSLGTTTKSVKYSIFVPMLIKAIQEQQTQIEILKTKIEILEQS